MSKLVLIDGNAIIHRAYHAMPPLRTPTGEPIGAVQGFVNILLKIIQDLEPTHIAVAFDRKEKTFRHKKFKKYQSHRPPVDNQLISQFGKIRDVVDAFDIESFDKAGFEADDIIGTLSVRAVQSKRVKEWKSGRKTNKHITPAPIDEVVIVTGDKDQMQLINARTKLFMPQKGLSNGQLIGEVEVVEKLGVRADQVIDLKALMGDPSDNYPGVYGIGPKTATTLLTQYDTYPNVYKHINEIGGSTADKLKKGKKDGDISYELAKIITDMTIAADFDKMDNWEVGNDKTLKLFHKFGFNNLTKRMQNIKKETEAKSQQSLF